MKKLLTAFLALILLCLASPPASADSESVELPILMYHHMSTLPGRWGAYVIPPETLEGDLKYLRDHGYESVTAQQLIDWSRGEGDLPEKPVMITFDDGQISFGEYAVPLLEKYGMSAVMNIVGKYADIYTETKDTDVRYAHFSWPALAELELSPAVELGVHTNDMHKLTASSRQGCRIRRGESASDYKAALNADLQQVEARFQDYLGYVPPVFAYPYGLYCDEAREVLAERGYRVVFTCEERTNVLERDPQALLALSRFCRRYDYDREKLFARMGIK